MNQVSIGWSEGTEQGRWPIVLYGRMQTFIYVGMCVRPTFCPELANLLFPGMFL
jgi:hypothetical protein